VISVAEQEKTEQEQEKLKKLNTKQQRFVEEYLIDHNATQAAIRAGYSKRTAGSIGEENLKKPEIKAAIDAGLEELRKKAAVTVEQIIAEYKRIAFADIKNFLEFKTVKAIVGHDKDGSPIFGYQNIVEVKPSDKVDGRVISEVSISKDGTFKFKLHDKKGALDALGKHLQMFIEKHEHTGADGGPIETSIKFDLTQLSDEELNLLERIINKSTSPTE